MRTTTPRTMKKMQVRANRMCTRISFFVSKKVREIRAYAKNTAEMSQPRAQPTDD